MSGRGVRITGGTARGLPLTEPRGLRLRPTAALVREAVFNILGDLTGVRVLDLYAGTGALGIEALSRGAAAAVFVEAEAAACQAILQSLARAGFADQGRVIRGRLPAALSALDGTFGSILLDPPYADETAATTLTSVAPLLAPDGMIVYEHASRYNPPERPAGLRLVDRRRYGDSAIALYRLQEGE
ncbi:MAG: 16S rRNA (guanine(966)-N(2))-methyltransferase RsmD [Dehalococcoidia bacterium]|nr:16S rRNA (guanine(966)-N(2))-methyltransferase RsmD [Dehalococcoidia bacterium]